MQLPNMTDITAALAAPKPSIHRAITDVFKKIPIETLFAVATEHYEKKHAGRLYGKRAVAHVLEGRERQRKRKRRTYWPKGWVVAPSGPTVAIAPETVGESKEEV